MTTPSPDIQLLIQNPEVFLSENPVGSQNLRVQDKPRYAMLIKRAEKIYEVQVAPGPGTNIIPAYLLGYKSIGIQGDNAAFIDIPKTADATTRFFFTAELSGCSLVVTDLNSTTYRVFHDSRPLSSALYKYVVMAADLTDYIRGLEVNPDELLLTVCLQYDLNSRRWRLFAQLLKENNPTQHWRIFRGTSSQILPNFFTRWPGEYTKPPLEDLRRQLQGELEQMIRTINSDMAAMHIPWMPFAIPTTQDGPFQHFNRDGVAPISTNPAVARTQALRERLAEVQARLVQVGYEQAYREILRSVTGRSKSVDTAYLWWLEKRNDL